MMGLQHKCVAKKANSHLAYAYGVSNKSAVCYSESQHAGEVFHPRKFKLQTSKKTFLY